MPTTLSTVLPRHCSRKTSIEVRNNAPSFKIGVMSLKMIPGLGKSGTSRTAARNLESLSSAMPSGPMLTAAKERSTPSTWLLIRTRSFTLEEDGSTAPHFCNHLLSGGGNQNDHFIPGAPVSPEPICFRNDRCRIPVTKRLSVYSRTQSRNVSDYEFI